MHYTARWVALTLLFCLPAFSSAQEANPDAALINTNRMDQLLEQWSNRTKKIKTLYAEFKRTTVEKTWNSKEEANGNARFKSPNHARLDVMAPTSKDKNGKGKSDEPVAGGESFILNGKGEIWEYQPAIQQITIHELPPGTSAKDELEDGPLPFLLGAPPEKAKARYRFTILSETERIAHIRIDPKLQDDKQNFVSSQLWLDKQSFLPHRLDYLEANGNNVSYDFTGIWVDIAIELKDFETPIIKNWRVVRNKPNNTAGRQAKKQDGIELR